MNGESRVEMGTITDQDIEALRELYAAASARVRPPAIPASSSQRLCAYGLAALDGAGGHVITRGGLRELQMRRKRRMPSIPKLKPRGRKLMWLAVAAAIVLSLIVVVFLLLNTAKKPAPGPGPGPEGKRVLQKASP